MFDDGQAPNFDVTLCNSLPSLNDDKGIKFWKRHTKSPWGISTYSGGEKDRIITPFTLQSRFTYVLATLQFWHFAREAIHLTDRFFGVFISLLFVLMSQMLLKRAT